MKKRSIALVLALVLLIGGIVGGTIAWLTAESSEVTNTFTVGKIIIELKEHDLKADGTLDMSAEVTEETTYKVVPGTEQPKDPFVRVISGSEKCYVYAKVTNNLLIDNEIVAPVTVNANWTAIQTSGNVTLYRYNSVVDASTADVTTNSVFEKVTYDGQKITKDNISQLDGKTIVIVAYAHQQAGQTQDEADTAAKAWAFPSATN